MYVTALDPESSAALTNVCPSERPLSGATAAFGASTPVLAKHGPLTRNPVLSRHADGQLHSVAMRSFARLISLAATASLLASCGGSGKLNASLPTPATTSATTTAAPQTTSTVQGITASIPTTTANTTSGQAWDDVCGALTLDELRAVIPGTTSGIAQPPDDTDPQVRQCNWESTSSSAFIYLRLMRSPVPNAFDAMLQAPAPGASKVTVPGAEQARVRPADGPTSLVIELTYKSYFVLLSVTEQYDPALQGPNGSDPPKLVTSASITKLATAVVSRL